MCNFSEIHLTVFCNVRQPRLFLPRPLGDQQRVTFLVKLGAIFHNMNVFFRKTDQLKMNFLSRTLSLFALKYVNKTGRNSMSASVPNIKESGFADELFPVLAPPL